MSLLDPNKKSQKPYLDSPRYSPFEKAHLENSIDAEKLLEKFSEIFVASPKFGRELSVDIQANLINSGEKRKHNFEYEGSENL